jgi:pimeloyl-ACP methyl ester carboxylesterase
VSVTEKVRIALQSAEAELFAAHDVEVSSRTLPLRDAPVRHARVLLAGPALEDRGEHDAPPLLLVHGAGTVASVWAPLLAALPDRTVIAVDLPGCGLTDRFLFDDHEDLRAHAFSFLTAVLDALGLEEVVIAGTSLGGMFALHLARCAPRRVAALVMLGDPAVALPVPGASTHGLASTVAGCRLLSRFGGRAFGPGAAKRFVAAIAGTPAVARQPRQLWFVLAPALRLSSRVTASLFLPLLRAGRDPERHGVSAADLAAVEVPTLLIWGEADVFQRADEGERAARAIPAARFERVSGGHLPWLDDAGRCGALITSFLDDLPSGTAGREVPLSA